MRLSKALLDAAFEDHAPVSNTRAATATDVAIRAEAQHAPATADAAQFAKLASGGFFSLTGVREDRRAALEELREAVERVRGLEAQAASPLFGEWKPPEGAREAGRDLAVETLSYASFKSLDKGVGGEVVKLSAAPRGRETAFKTQRGGEAAEGRSATLYALGDEKAARAAVEAALAIRRVMEEAEIAVRPVVAIAFRALAKAGERLTKEVKWERVVERVGLTDDEFKRAFNVAGDRRPLYFVYLVGDVEYGAVKARGVRAVAFVSGAKTLRIEILAEGVEGMTAERVKALGGEWFRLATFEIEVGSGMIYLTPRVEVSVSVRVEPILAKHLSALALTDAGHGGRELGGPDPTLHLLYVLAVGETEVKVKRVVFTEAGPTLHLETRALVATRVDKLFEEVRGELASKGLRPPDMDTLRKRAKSKAVEIIGEYAGKAKRIAEEVKSVEELRVKLIKLFDEVAREAAVKYKEAKDKGEKEMALWMAVGAVVAKKFFAENVDDPVWWTLLLLGDGVVRVRDHELGFAARPAEAAEAVMYVFARVMGVPLEVRREGEGAMLNRDASRAAVERLFKRLEEARVGNTPALLFFTAVAEWWLGVGAGGSNPPKLISLLAFRELAAGKEGKWLGAWLSYEAVATPAPEEVGHWFDGVYRVSVKPSRDHLTGAVSFDVYFEHSGKRFKLHTDFASFYLSCKSCGKAAKDVLRAVAMALGLEEPGWDKKRLVFPADVGWATFLKLWARYSKSFPIEENGKELLRVEVLEARADGTAKLRLWYHKWQETGPDRPYVDFEIAYKGENQGFKGYVSANEAKGILREHLVEIAELLKREGIKGVSLVRDGKELYFTGAFRDSVLSRLGVKPELPPGEPPTVGFLGGLKFKVNDKEVEFGRGHVKGGYEFYAELKFASRDEAVNFASSLKAVGVDAGVAGSETAGHTVRLDSDAFFGLLAAANAVPPGLTPLYRSNDLRVYASAEEGRMRFYFAAKYKGVWRAVEGVYAGDKVQLKRAEREVLEAITSAVAEALERLTLERPSRPAEVEEPKEDRDRKGNVVSHYLQLYDHHLVPFLKHAAEDARTEPAEVRLEGKRIVIKADDAKAEVEFKPLKRKEAEFLLVKDVGQTLVVYKSLKALGVPVEITPKGVKVDGGAMWALVATAVERSTPNKLPAEVMSGVELLNVHCAGGLKLYIFRAEGVHYYFAVKTEKEWRTTGGKYVGKMVRIYGEPARAIAEAINAIYSNMGVDRRVEVRQMKDGTPYIRLTKVDLELLGLMQP